MTQNKLTVAMTLFFMAFAANQVFADETMEFSCPPVFCPPGWSLLDGETSIVCTVNIPADGEMDCEEDGYWGYNMSNLDNEGKPYDFYAISCDAYGYDGQGTLVDEDHQAGRCEKD